MPFKFVFDHPNVHRLIHRLLNLKPMYSLGEWWKWNISVMGFAYRAVWVLKALWIFLSETINFLRKLNTANIFWMPPKILPCRVMYIVPSSGHISLNSNMPLIKLILRMFEVNRCFSDVWSENAALFERLMEFHSNPAILYYMYGFIKSEYHYLQM